jgi:hypothetical protein
VNLAIAIDKNNGVAEDSTRKLRAARRIFIREISELLPDVPRPRVLKTATSIMEFWESLPLSAMCLTGSSNPTLKKKVTCFSLA